MFDLKDRVAIVTGASGDIGQAIAKLLHSRGANVVISGTNIAKLEQLEAKLAHNVRIKLCDLGDDLALEDLVQTTYKEFSKIDILVCNAGINKDNLAIRMKTEEFDNVININLRAAFILNKACIKLMMKAKYGRIVNISSIVGVMGNPGQANYCASKAGLIGMTKALAAETATRNITLNCVAPGFIETAMTAKLPEQQRQRLASLIPSGIFGTAQDVANAVAFLVSTESSYITGQTLHVNGGMLMV